MVRYYFFFGPKPVVREVYNPLQKLAYTSVIGLGVLSVLTGLAVWKPVQLSWLAWMMGGFHWARIWHFAVMWAILFFLLLTPFGLLWRLPGKDPLSPRPPTWRGWETYPERYRNARHFDRMF